LAGGVWGLTGGAIHGGDAGGSEFAGEVESGVGELGEEEKFLVRVLVTNEADEGLKFPIRDGGNGAGALEQAVERVGVATQGSGEGFLKNVGTQPAEASLLTGGEKAVKGGGLGDVVGNVPLGEVGELDRLGVVVLIFERKLALALVAETGVERGGVGLADGDGQAVFEGVEEKIISQNVAVERKEEGVAGAFEALEKVGLAEAHEAATGAGEVVNDLEVGGGEVGRGRGLEVTAEAVARQVEKLDDAEHVGPEELGARIVG